MILIYFTNENPNAKRSTIHLGSVRSSLAFGFFLSKSTLAYLFAQIAHQHQYIFPIK